MSRCRLKYLHINDLAVTPLLVVDQENYRSAIDTWCGSTLALLFGRLAGPSPNVRYLDACRGPFNASPQYLMRRMRILTVDRTARTYGITDSNEYIEAVYFLLFTYARGAHQK